VAVLLLAIVLDLAFGDPPSRVHPVAGLGRALAAGRRILCVGGPVRLLAGGAFVTLAAAALAALAGALVAGLASMLGPWGVVPEVLALTLLLSLRGLERAASGVRASLERGDLDGARTAVGLHLVSRDTAALDAGHVASAAVESVAENLTDSYVAPACFYLLFGLPGAAIYRAINTADAMLGYRGGPLEHFGKTAARLDDLANLLPARLAGIAVVAAASVTGADARGAWSTMLRDRGLTASPNAGWTMAAMAGALGVTLEKSGAYRLGRGALPTPADVTRSVRLTLVSAGLATALLAIIWMVAKSAT